MYNDLTTILYHKSLLILLLVKKIQEREKMYAINVKKPKERKRPKEISPAH